MSEPIITIIVPIYNMEDYLKKCLESLIIQTYANIEILCIDDCSTDKSVQIVEKFVQKDRRIKLIKHNINKGLGGARNTGLANTQGEYILFVDSDDFIHPTMVEKLYLDLIKNEADMSFCDIKLYENDDTIYDYKPFHDTRLASQKLFFPQERLEPFTNIWPSAWNKLYKTSIIRNNRLNYFENIYYEDHSFYYNYLLNCKRVSYLPESLYFYRHNRPNSIMKEISPRIFEIFVILKYLKKIFAKIFDKNDFKRIYLKIKIRLLWERTMPFQGNSRIEKKFIRRAKKELSRYTLEEILTCKDKFIDKNSPIIKKR